MLEEYCIQIVKQKCIIIYVMKNECELCMLILHQLIGLSSTS